MDAYSVSVRFDARVCQVLWIIEMVILDWIFGSYRHAVAACMLFSFRDWFFDEEYLGTVISHAEKPEG